MQKAAIAIILKLVLSAMNGAATMQTAVAMHTPINTFISAIATRGLLSKSTLNPIASRNEIKSSMSIALRGDERFVYQHRASTSPTLLIDQLYCMRFIFRVATLLRMEKRTGLQLVLLAPEDQQAITDTREHFSGAVPAATLCFSVFEA